MFVQFYLKLNKIGLESYSPPICRRDFEDSDIMVVLAADFSGWLSHHVLEVNGTSIVKDGRVVGRLLKIVPTNKDVGYRWYFECYRK